MTESMDVSKLLLPGVYVLRERGRVIWVGRAKVLLTAIHGTSARQVGPCFPGSQRTIKFDNIEIYPCGVNEVNPLWARLCAELSWSAPAFGTLDEKAQVIAFTSARVRRRV